MFLVLLLFLLFLCLQRQLLHLQNIIFFTAFFITRYGFGSTAFHEQLLLILIKLFQIFRQLVGVHMVHPDQLPQHLHSVQVVHGKHSTALVHVAEEPKAPALPTGVVSDQVDVHNLPILREHADDISLSHLVGQPSKEHPGRVLVLLVPGVLGAGHPGSQLPLVHLQLIVGLRLGIHCYADKCSLV